ERVRERLVVVLHAVRALAEELERGVGRVHAEAHREQAVRALDRGRDQAGDRQAGERRDLDVGHVVAEAAAVRVAVELRRARRDVERVQRRAERAGGRRLEVAEQTTPVGVPRQGAGRLRLGVQTQLVDGLLVGPALAEGQVDRAGPGVEAAEQDRRDVGAAGLLGERRAVCQVRADAGALQDRTEDARVQRLHEAGRGVVLLELLVLRGRPGVPEVLLRARDQHLVDERLAKALDLLPLRHADAHAVAVAAAGDRLYDA